MMCPCRCQPYGLINVASRETKHVERYRSEAPDWLQASHSPAAYIKRIAGPRMNLPCMFAQRTATTGSKYKALLCARRSCSATETNNNANNHEKMCGRASQ